MVKAGQHGRKEKDSIWIMFSDGNIQIDLKLTSQRRMHENIGYARKNVLFAVVRNRY